MFARFSLNPNPAIYKPLILSNEITNAGKGRRLCLVSDTSAAAPPTATQLAEWFIKDGWNVTLLDLSGFDGPKYSPHTIADNKKKSFAANSIKQSSKTQTDRTYDYVALSGIYEETNWYTPMQSLCTYQWLKDKDFDVIFFHHAFGSGHFSCNAREMGLAFSSTVLLACGDDPYAHWLEDCKWLPGFIRTDMEVDFFERETIRRCDGVLFTLQSSLDWMSVAEWPLSPEPDKVALLGTNKGIPYGQWIAAKIDEVKRRPLPKKEDIFISVCMSTYNRPDQLRSAISYIEAQTYKNFELIVVDDGSTNPGVDAVRKELEPLFSARKWRWVKQENAGPAAGRMHAVKLSKADYFLFMDDDNIALPDELDMFAQAAVCGADIISCIYGLAPRSDPPPPCAYLPSRPGYSAPLPVYWIPYGICLGVNIYANTLGDTNALFRRKAFDELGGFQGDRTMLMEDWELLTRAAVAGYRIEVMPEIVHLNHRHGACRHLHGETIMESQIDALKPVAAIMPPALRPLLLGLRSSMNNYQLRQPARFRSATAIDRYKGQKSHPLFHYEPAKDTIHVAICTDDNYAIPACAMLASLFSSTTRPMEVYVISGMSDDKVADMMAVGDHFNRHINIIHYGENEAPTAIVGQYLSKLVYARLYLPKLLPHLQKVLYLDCDLIVRHDIGELWDHELGDNLIGAISDPIFAFDKIPLKDYGGDYFNSGVMLINLKRWREEDITAKVVEQVLLYEKARDPLQYWDQSPLNRTIAGRWKSLSLKWNFSEWGMKGLAKFYRLTPNEYRDICEDPCIYHFIVAAHKPWLDNQKKRTAFAYEYQIYERMVRMLWESTTSYKSKPRKIAS